MDNLGSGQRPLKRGKGMQAREDASRGLLDRQSLPILVEGILGSLGAKETVDVSAYICPECGLVRWYADVDD